MLSTVYLSREIDCGMRTVAALCCGVAFQQCMPNWWLHAFWLVQLQRHQNYVSLLVQSAIDEATVNLNKTRAAFQHVIDKARDPNNTP